MDEEKNYRMNAVALLAQRDAEGRVARDADGTGQLIGKQTAQQIMRDSLQVNEGQGSFSLLVSKRAVDAAGLGEVWEKAQAYFPLMRRDGKDYYRVGDYRQSVALTDLLELQAGTSWAATQQASGQGHTR